MPSTVTEKVALNAGSSKQGKAARAKVASNCVAVMFTVAPLSSLYVDRYSPSLVTDRGDEKAKASVTLEPAGTAPPSRKTRRSFASSGA